MIFGMHVQLPTTQPTITFGAQRLWDTGTRWNQIETSRGVYDWSVFDAWLAKATAPLLYTFGGTPAWAAADKSLPPTDMAMWDEFVQAVVTRAAGRIEAYELWNEPNLRKFFSGTVAQMVEMSRRAFQIIKTADKGHQAIVVSPSPTWSTTYNVPAGKSGTDCASGSRTISTRVEDSTSMLLPTTAIPIGTIPRAARWPKSTGCWRL
jgi:hypothetical protein